MWTSMPGLPRNSVAQTTVWSVRIRSTAGRRTACATDVGTKSTLFALVSRGPARRCIKPSPQRPAAQQSSPVTPSRCFVHRTCWRIAVPLSLESAARQRRILRLAPMLTTTRPGAGPVPILSRYAGRLSVYDRDLAVQRTGRYGQVLCRAARKIGGPPQPDEQ